MPSRRSSLAALAIYLGVTLLYFGEPILAHPGRLLIGNGVDPEIFVWSLGWWPHAVLHGENPFFTHAIWAPYGVDLAWTTSIPGLALLFSPLTLLFGPALSYNALAILIPALDAFTAYLLCRHLTRRFWPSLAGGYLFGFSSYVLGQTEGHPHMSAVFLLPLIALVVVRRIEGSLPMRRFVLFVGVLLACQFSFSTELFFTASLALAAALILAFIAVPAVRSRAAGLVVGLVGGYVLALVLVSPLLVYALLHFQHGSINPPVLFPGDLLNVVVPTQLTWLHTTWTLHASSLFRGNTAENGGYLGLPVLAILGWFAWEGRRRATTWLLIAFVVLGVFLELGDSLHVEGNDVLPLPWAHVANLPIFENVLPARFSVFVAFAAAMIVALWASRSRAPVPARAGLVVLAIVFLVPHLWLSAWHVHPERPAFFTDGTYRACFTAADNVMVLPDPSHDDAMLWQAEAGYAFRLANGNISPIAPKAVPYWHFAQDLMSGYRPPTDAPLLRLAKAQGVTTILIPGDRTDWAGTFANRHVTSLDGVFLVAVTPDGSPCASG